MTWMGEHLKISGLAGGYSEKLKSVTNPFCIFARKRNMALLISHQEYNLSHGVLTFIVLPAKTKKTIQSHCHSLLLAEHYPFHKDSLLEFCDFKSEKEAYHVLLCLVLTFCLSIPRIDPSSSGGHTNREGCLEYLLIVGRGQ